MRTRREVMMHLGGALLATGVGRPLRTRRCIGPPKGLELGRLGAAAAHGKWERPFLSSGTVNHRRYAALRYIPFLQPS